MYHVYSLHDFKEKGRDLTSITEDDVCMATIFLRLIWVIILLCRVYSFQFLRTMVTLSRLSRNKSCVTTIFFKCKFGWSLYTGYSCMSYLQLTFLKSKMVLRHVHYGRYRVLRPFFFSFCDSFQWSLYTGFTVSDLVICCVYTFTGFLL